MRWILMLLTLYSAQVLAETSLWRVSKGSHELFIGGTVHVLSKADYPLPTAFDNAFAKADKLVFETDIAASEDPAFGQAMMQRMMYSDGRRLKDGLSPQVYQQLESFATSRGIPVEVLQQMRPVMAVLTLTILELRRLGMGDAGVDHYYFQRAQAQGKLVGQLETNDQQLEFIANLGKGRENDFVLYSLKDMRTMEAAMHDLTAAWRSGDQDKMASLALVSMREEFPDIYQQLLVTRNNNWLPQIESMLNDPGTELVLVGALHLVGEDGILQRLRERGYHIEQR